MSFGSEQATSFPRRLTSDTIQKIRARNPIRRGPLRRRHQIDVSDDDSDGEDAPLQGAEEEVDLCPDCCCCCTGRGFCACCLLALAGVFWSVAISLGIMHKPTYEEVARPVRVARRFWFSKTPTGADDGFMLFDRDADGLITKRDLANVASIVGGEPPPPEQVERYISRADVDGDGALNETEYLSLLHEERVIRARQKEQGLL